VTLSVAARLTVQWDKRCVCVCVCVTVQWDKRFRFYGLGFRVFAVQYGTDGLEFRV
jgi:hypothetical protein